MGLDMYLYKRSYIFSHDIYKENINESVDVWRGGQRHPSIKPERIKYVTEEVGYWRKANQIHNWFVENVQKGIDECQESYVSRKKLEQLLSICKEVIMDPTKAPELLPTSKGFFFGSDDYDKWYMEDIKSTIDILEENLSDTEADDFYYRASW